MAAGSSADPFASSVSVWWDVTTITKMRRALNFPLSPHSVGLITTSCSVPQPLRKHCSDRMHLPRMWLFWTNSVTDSSASSCLGSAPLTAAFTELFRQSCLLPIWALRDLFGPGLHQWNCTEECEQLKHFRRKVYLGEKTLKELSYFHVLFFFNL